MGTRRLLAAVLFFVAGIFWLMWLAYSARALIDQTLPVTWTIFALFLSLVLIFLLPALLLLLLGSAPTAPVRFHASIWLIITGYYWIIAPLYQYLAINTNRELVLWYMIPYAWEVPVLGLAYYLPLAIWYRRGRSSDALPMFAAFYFAFIAFIGYGPVGSYQFRVLGEAPWPEVIKNLLTGTVMGFVSGFIVYFYFNQILRRKIFSVRRELTAVATALVVLAYVVYVPVSYRSAQELLATEVGEDLLHDMEDADGGELLRREDVGLLVVEPEIGRALRVLDHPQSFYSHRRANRIIAAVPAGLSVGTAGEFVRIAVKSESEFSYLLRPFIYRGAVVGVVFGGIFALLMSLVIRLAEAYERRRSAELSLVNRELHEKTAVVERVLADVKVVDEKLASLNRAKSEFISMASHQLRTPLTAVKWYAKLLAKEGVGALSPTQRRALVQIATSNDKMIELVNDLLNVSRIEMGTVAVNPEPLTLGAAIKGFVESVKPLANERKIAIVAHGGPVTIRADKKLLEAVVVNLLTNAIRYSPPRRGRVEVLAARRGGRAVITVKDNGFGIPAAEQGAVFSKFFRGSNIASRMPDGTGLGLYIVRSVVSFLGGTISFTSREGKGTTFIVSLPLSGVRPRAGQKGLTLS